ncbi:TonB-dependent receptor family protein [Rheinheimera sp. 4Y26]|uniref:TonB-dependent receptor family protein n=1 Tax=Rheinheimera sp. 4Y26 TaxID=2977811 RepID=UPI0021B1526E|nr:TonB-dependent receptor [Rheinheimera sp. 4Y26]MCT6700383.1 TonB-dependent receptor [Rheinheimera sp. 4Y26]
MSANTLRYSRLAKAVALFCVASPLYAADAANATLDEVSVIEKKAEKKKATPTLEVIKITASSADAHYLETGTVNLVSLEQIEQVQPLSTEDVLRRIPGVNIKTEDETAVVANFGIRGLSASESKSLMLEDGVPVAPGLFIGNERYFNPRIQRVATVEVLKGSASLRYGPSTIGGVVNYQTKTPDDGVELSGRLGSFNTRELSVEAGNRNASGDAYAGVIVSHAKSDGFMDKGYDMTDILAKAGVEFANNQKLGIKVSRHENDANISYRGLLLGEYLADVKTNPAPDDFLLIDRTAFDINHEWQINNDMTLNTVAYYSDMARDYWRYGVNSAASNAAGRWVYTNNLNGNNRAFERVGIESRLSVEHQLAGLNSSSEFGLRLMSEESDDQRIAATRAADRSGTLAAHLQDSADSVAAYAQSRIQLTEQLAMTPGVRIESYEQKRLNLLQNNNEAKTTNTEVLPGVGFTYSLDNNQLYGGLYRAFSPAANNVALDGLKDQQLDGERSVNYEMGIRGTTDKTRYDVAAFMMDFSNQVVTGNSDPNLSRSNAGETRHYGMEFSLGYSLATNLMLDSNLTWVPESEFRTGSTAGNRIPYAPKVIANLGLSYDLSQWNFALNLHHRGEQFGDPSNRIDIPANAASGIWGGLLPAYTVLDLLAQYDVSSQFNLFASVKNLADKRYITGLREGIYVGPERSFELGARYRF